MNHLRKLVFITIFILTSHVIYAESDKPFDASSKEISSPLWWRQHASQEAQRIKDQKMRDVAFKDIARALGWSGDFKTVSQCIEKITNQEDKKRTYEVLAHDCHKAGNMSCYESNMQQVRLLSVNGKYPNYSLIIDYLQYNDVKGAKSFTESIVNKQERNSAYYRIALHLAENGDLYAAEEIFTDKIPEYTDDSTLENVAVAIAKKNYDKSMEIVSRISKAKEKDAALTKIAIIQAVKADFSSAWKIANQVKNQEQKSSIIAAIAAKQIKEGDFTGAETTIDKILLRDDKIGVFFSIAEEQIRNGSIDAALVRIKAIESLIAITPTPADKSKFGTFDDTAKLAQVRMLHSKIAGQLAKRGDMDGYSAHMKIAQQAMTSIKPEAGIMQAFMIMDVVKNQLDAGDLSGARATLTMPGIDDSAREMAADEIMRKQLALGDINGAMATIKTVKDRAYAYGAISAKLVESGKMTEAIKLLSTIDFKKEEIEVAFMYEPAASYLGKAQKLPELIKWVAIAPTPEARVYVFLGAARGIEAAAKTQ